MLCSNNCTKTDCIFHGEPSADWVYCEYCKWNKEKNSTENDFYKNNPYLKDVYFDSR